MSNHIEELHLTREHATKQEQVDASTRFVLQNNKAYYDALANLPSRVKESLMTIIIDWTEPSGYHFAVLRAAQKQYSRGSGFIAIEEPPFTHEELYP